MTLLGTRKMKNRKSKLHTSWQAMKQRCKNPNTKNWHRYGGRGIIVCKEWETFEAFADWAKGAGYREGSTIDRIDVDGDYEPDNCQWLSREENGKKGVEETRELAKPLSGKLDFGFHWGHGFTRDEIDNYGSWD